MIRTRLPFLALLIAAGTVACTRDAAPPAAAPGASARAAAAGTPLRAEGIPQLANSADGVHIEYRTYGSGEPAVVLVHGWSCDANYWSAQIAALKAHFTVVTVDLAGHGASGRNRTDWTMANYGEDVAAVVRQLPNRQIVLVGHSMGATVALEATRRIGDRVIGIIAVDALKSIGQPPMPQKQIDTRLAAFRADFIGETRKFVTESLFPKGSDPRFVSKVAYDMSLEPADIGVASMQSLLATDLAPVVADIHVPVLAINSDLTATDEARIRRSLPDFSARVIPGTSHFLMMQDAQRFNPVLLADVGELVRKAHH